MVLKVRHSIDYYRKFSLDIWGAVFTVFRIKKRPQFPPIKKLVKSAWNKFTSMKLWKKIPSKIYKIFIKKKFTKLPLIKPSSKKNTKFPWKIKSRKMTFVQLMLYKFTSKKKRKKKIRKKRYTFTLDDLKKMKKMKRMKKRFLSLRLTKLFYITITYRQFRKLARIMRRKIGAFEHNYLLALEGRLMSYLYRTSLITNPFYAMKFIKQGNVLVNFRCQKHYNYRVLINDLVTFASIAKRILFLTVLPRIKKKRTYFNSPRYMFLSYIFLYSYQMKPPVAKDLVFPISMDFYRATGYAF